MKIFGQGAILFSLKNVLFSIFHDFDGRVEKIEHLCAKIGCLPFSLACYFCANKKRNEYDEKDWKIKRMADVAS